MAGLEGSADDERRGDARRLALAEEFLQEAVFRSRAAQAAGGVFAAPAVDSTGRCGLGAEAAVELELTPRGAEIFAQLWPSNAPSAAPVIDNVRTHLEIRAHLREWIERQDALDRQRNHFLKAFRHKHGLDRAAYSPEQLAHFEDGLERINAEVAEERRAAAQRLSS